MLNTYILTIIKVHVKRKIWLTLRMSRLYTARMTLLDVSNEGFGFVIVENNRIPLDEPVRTPDRSSEGETGLRWCNNDAGLLYRR